MLVIKLQKTYKNLKKLISNLQKMRADQPRHTTYYTGVGKKSYIWQLLTSFQYKTKVHPFRRNYLSMLLFLDQSV